MLHRSSRVKNKKEKTDKKKYIYIFTPIPHTNTIRYLLNHVYYNHAALHNYAALKFHLILRSRNIFLGNQTDNLPNFLA